MKIKKVDKNIELSNKFKNLMKYKIPTKSVGIYSEIGDQIDLKTLKEVVNIKDCDNVKQVTMRAVFKDDDFKNSEIHIFELQLSTFEIPKSILEKIDNKDEFATLFILEHNGYYNYIFSLKEIKDYKVNILKIFERGWGVALDITPSIKNDFFKKIVFLITGVAMNDGYDYQNFLQSVKDCYRHSFWNNEGSIIETRRNKEKEYAKRYGFYNLSYFMHSNTINGGYNEYSSIPQVVNIKLERYNYDKYKSLKEKCEELLNSMKLNTGFNVHLFALLLNDLKENTKFQKADITQEVFFNCLEFGKERIFDPKVVDKSIKINTFKFAYIYLDTKNKNTAYLTFETMKFDLDKFIDDFFIAKPSNEEKRIERKIKKDKTIQKVKLSKEGMDKYFKKESIDVYLPR